MPSLTAAMGRSAITALAWASTQARSSTRKSATSTVSCTVSAVTVGAAWQPWAIRASMSACRPAPPEGSWPDRQRTMGREVVLFMARELSIFGAAGSAGLSPICRRLWLKPRSRSVDGPCFTRSNPPRNTPETAMSLHQFAETHEVFNQVPPLDGANLYRLDLPLRE